MIPEESGGDSNRRYIKYNSLTGSPPNTGFQVPGCPPHDGPPRAAKAHGQRNAATVHTTWDHGRPPSRTQVGGKMVPPITERVAIPCRVPALASAKAAEFR